MTTEIYKPICIYYVCEKECLNDAAWANNTKQIILYGLQIGRFFDLLQFDLYNPFVCAFR